MRSLAFYPLALGLLMSPAVVARRVLSKTTQCTKPACAQDVSKPIFFDMLHSNNAGRIRLFIRSYVTEAAIPICMVTYADMRCQWFKDVNPNQKVPAIVIPAASGVGKKTIYESNVIFDYLVETTDCESDEAVITPAPPIFKHRTLPPMERAEINLMCRVHDLYIASPNCNQPGCTHTQGALYLAPPGKWDDTNGRRAIDSKTRAGKFAELWTRWTWLEDVSEPLGGPYLAGNHMSLADMTWFPTAIFMEFLLKHVAEWPTLFADVQADGTTADFTASLDRYGDWVSSEVWNPGLVDEKMKARFPRLSAWYPFLLQNEKFREVRSEILGYWVNERHLDSQWKEGDTRSPRFPPILQAIAAAKDLSWVPADDGFSLGWPSSPA